MELAEREEVTREMAPMQRPAATPSPLERLSQLQFSFAPSRILATAIQLDVFSHLASGRKTPAAVASLAGASVRGTRMILDALVGFELLSKRDGAYELTPVTRQYYVRDSPDFIGYILMQDSLWNAWGHLTESVRTGKPAHSLNDEEQGEEFFGTLVRGLHVLNREPAQRLARALDAGADRRGSRVLDVACGSGVWGIAIAERDPDTRVTAQDFPPMLDLTREYARRHGVAERYDYLPGDLRRVDLGDARYDTVLLGNIVHSEGERSSRDLFGRSHRALKPGGRLVILDMVPNDERTGPPFPLLFALNMLVATDEGDTYTRADYTRWLTDAGFARVETADIGSHSPAIIGVKAGD